VSIILSNGGCSCSPGGIGHALALCLHKRDFRVFATARKAEALSSLTSAGIEAIALEVNNDESIQSCLKRIKTLTDGMGLDMLINNAGVNYTVPALDVDISEARTVFDTNVWAVMRLCQVFAPLLIQAKGTIVMIGSLAAVMPYAFGSVYSASKAALHAYTNTLRVELAPFDVKVITVVSGGVITQLATRLKRVLPENSYYSELDEAYQRRQVYAHESGMPVEQYAEKLLPQIIPGGGPWPWRLFLGDARKRWIWHGAKSSMVYWLSGGWTWSGIFDWYFTKTFQLDKLRSSSKAKDD
jgi:1-acylglycerone phosphate reductase